MSSAQITHTCDAAFDADVLKSDAPALVDFWADWRPSPRNSSNLLAEIHESEARL
jgi:thioredoxin 1